MAGAQEFAVEIAASPADCFRIITDFAAYPRWSSAVRQARVLERDDAGIGRRVEFRIDMRFKSIRYVLAYDYRKPIELTWYLVEGDVESIEGAYQFRRLGPRLTEATCQQAVLLGFWVPGPIRKLAERTALRQSVLEFKEEVERRIASRPSRSRRSG